MSPLWKLVTRVRAADPRRLDLVLGLVAGIALVVETFASRPGDPARYVTAALGLAAVLPTLALRRRAPVVAAAIFCAATVGDALTDSFFVTGLTTPFLALLILLYSAGRHAGGRRIWLAVALIAAGLGAALLAGPDFGGAGDLLYVLMLLSLPVIAGRAVRSRVLLQRELRVKALRAEAEREERARRAVEVERDRIAEELQAVVANGVSAMVVQAGAVPRVLAAGGEGEARDAFHVIEETGRDALTEMRRLLGVLRRDEGGATLAPQPGLGRLKALLERARDAGLEVDLTERGEDRSLPVGVDLTAYRIIQQALETATAAAATRVWLTIEFTRRELELQVRDDREDRAQGIPPGMRERVRLYDGHVSAGPDRDGHAIRVRIPVERTPA
jgi:signal transduction histidine kinase